MLPSSIPMMHFFAPLLTLFMLQGASAQQPPKQADLCPLVVPTSLAYTDELPPQVTCNCRITAFKATVYNRMGMAMLNVDEPTRFTAAVLENKELASGTYLWVVEYTVIVGTEAVERKATGYLNVL